MLHYSGMPIAALKLDTMRVEKPWGRRSLPPPFATPGATLAEPVGEIWFALSGRPLDLMVKYIFTSEKLSIQVHPSDEQARRAGHRQGKEECWYILDAEQGACVGIGTKYPLDGRALADACRSGEIEALMEWIPVRAGDFFYIPAGTVHAIGVGISLVEIQQNADITYRLYDYGRPRELHLDLGVDVADARPYPAALRRHVSTAEPVTLVDGPKFKLAIAQGESPRLDGRGPYYIVPLEGALGTDDGVARAGDCVVTGDPSRLAPCTGARMFVARSCGSDASPASLAMNS
jgi:mannose-6-phosphate isomerase